jgi:hypothetical protein
MLTKVDTEVFDDYTRTEYTCDEVVQLAGDSLWNCALNTVRVTGIVVFDYTDYKTVNVTHDGGDDSWTIYTDTGFEAAISNMLGYEVGFTEQGMQEDDFASMEG